MKGRLCLPVGDLWNDYNLTTTVCCRRPPICVNYISLNQGKLRYITDPVANVASTVSIYKRISKKEEVFDLILFLCLLVSSEFLTG